MRTARQPAGAPPASAGRGWVCSALGVCLLAGALGPSAGCTAALWEWAREPGGEIWPAPPVKMRAADGKGTWIVSDFRDPSSARMGTYGFYVPDNWHEKPLVRTEGKRARMELTEPLPGGWKVMGRLQGPAEPIRFSAAGPPGPAGKGTVFALERQREMSEVADEIYAWHAARGHWVHIAAARPGAIQYRSTWGRKVIAVLATPPAVAMDIVFGAFIVAAHAPVY